MKCWYDWEEYEFIGEEKIDNQTLRLGIYQDFFNERTNTLYFNIWIALYNKRKHTSRNEDEKRITGKNPMATFFAARKIFDELEKMCLADYLPDYNVVLYCTWLDHRRRDAYYKVLSKKGYQYGTVGRSKAILKRFERGDFNDFI